MAQRQVLILNEQAPRIEVPQSGDSYVMPRSLTINSSVIINGSLVASSLTVNGAVTITGSVIMSGLPTSDPSVAGQLFSSSGNLQISSG